ncbi:hypothetical protein [Agrobacterium tumefaciens]|uniref:hypothetical protein n=1 Tax=Agrobacterium tumefaciens TaxID=358 RepID=UPI001ADAFE35|nr:hypothetical protein [Agrobacterium tumefaciens]
MALNYDTQVELIFPAVLFQDSNAAAILMKAGIDIESPTNKILLFTDSRTVAALNAADENVKTALSNSGIGLVLFGSNIQLRVDFLFEALREVSAKYAGEPLNLAILDIMRFVRSGMMGKLNPNPFASQLPPSSEKFDLSAALMAMASPEQMNKPKAPEHRSPFRIFGRRKS